MKRLTTGTMLLASLALAIPAWAAPGQCSFTGFDTFACDIQFDGGGLAFGLPNGQVFAFAVTDQSEGQGYLIASDAAPGRPPVEIGSFEAQADQPGCWLAEDRDLTFCALVFE